MPKPERGEVWQVDFGLAAKVRPALIVSAPISETDRALYAVMPHTTAVRNSQFEVPLQIRWLENGAFDAQGIRPVPGKVLLRKLGNLTAVQITEVETAIKRWLQLK